MSITNYDLSRSSTINKTKAKFKLVEISAKQQATGLSHNCSSRILNRLVGHANESTMELAKVKTKCLIDTGFMVTTISEQFYLDHLQPDYPLKSFGDLLSVEVESAGL